MATRELTLEEKLQRFAERWKGFSGTELSAAQNFLRELKECYGIWEHAPGTVFEQHPMKPVAEANGVLFEDAPRRRTGARLAVTADRMDMYIPKVVVWEMKGPGEKDLCKHHAQLLGYWSRTLPRYMVLCNFREFWVYDTDQEGGQLNPAIRFTLAELPANASALKFLSGEEAYFAQRGANVTREAADYVGGVLRELVRESKDPQRDRTRFTKFTLECVFAMFAEDSGILPTKPFSLALKKAVASGELTPVFDLFDDLGRPAAEDRSNVVPYVNGPLFDRQHPKFRMAQELLNTLYIAAEKYDWQAVRPEVFGNIFERSLQSDERHAAGAHFTAEADIMKVVGPTVVRPWQERIAACKFRKDAEKLIERMRHYHILDPACGSGNFLYIAYREMKRLEAALREKHFQLWRHKDQKRAGEKYPAPPSGPWFTIHQLHGIDKLPEAVQLTRVVLWIGEHLANSELSLGETTLPLTSLDENIIEDDALFCAWFRPPEDGVSELAIIGNPPFMGSKKMRSALGDEYVNSLFTCFPESRIADLVTYWYRVALRVLRKGEHCGFVSTNSIAQNESRQGSIDLIISSGGTLVDCWKSYPWPGEAAVHVSIVNWIQDKYGGEKFLESVQVGTITPALTDKTDTTNAVRLEENLGLCFQGVVPGNIEFVLDERQRSEIIANDPKSSKVIKPFLIGADINRNIDQSPSRFVIDFGNMSLEEAKHYKGAFQYAQKYIYPVRKHGLDRKEARMRENWWQMVRPRGEMRELISSVDYFIAISCITPHVFFVRVSKDILPDHRLFIFGLPHYYHFGVLQSAVHEYWAWERGATLEDRLAYTNTTIFETFPFPYVDGGKGRPPHQYDPRIVPQTKEAKQVAKVAEELYTTRQAACISLNLGLTKLYNYIKGKSPLSNLSAEHQEIIQELQSLHEQLNDAVNKCYGWPAGTWRDDNEVLKRLLEMNRELTS